MNRIAFGSVARLVAKEPLLHFLLAGTALFGAYAWINPAAEKRDGGEARQVHIRSGDIEWLAENWTTQWRRPPVREELRGLVKDYLDEQLLAREARALGLDDNDVIVRRRLAQKLTFLLEDTQRLVEPSETELQRFYAEHEQRFRIEARISFSHVYFSAQHRADARSDARNALSLLRQASTSPTLAEWGDRLLIGAEFDDETEGSVSSAFGPAFARAIFSLDIGAWSDPIESGFGLHLVRVSGLRGGQQRPFADVRARVLEEWRHQQQRSARERYLAELRRKYDVVIDDAIKPLVAPVTAAATVRP
jgi:hypothetical protein